MSRSQPPHNHTNGPSRGGHGQDRVRSHGSSHHSNGGSASNQHTSSQNAGSPQQQTHGTNGHGNYQPPNSSQNPQNGHTQHIGYNQNSRYVPVPRPWRHQNPEIDRVINNPALEVAPSRNAQHYAPYYALPPAPPPPPPGFPPNGRNTYWLTAENLHQHERRRTPSDPLRRFERQNQRDGPYDTVGRIRRDGQVYEEDAEWSDGYHDYDE